MTTRLWQKVMLGVITVVVLTLLMALLPACTPKPAAQPTAPAAQPSPAPSAAPPAAPAAKPAAPAAQPTAPTAQPTAPAAQPIIIKLQHMWPGPQSPQVSEGIMPFVNAVEKQTAGRVKFEIYTVDQLVSSKDYLNAVSTGVIDIAPCSPGYDPGKLKLSQVWALPFAFPNTRAVAKSLEEFLAILDPAEYAPLNMRNMLDQTFLSNYHIWNTKRPIKTAADLKGLKIRGTGGVASKALDLLGATSVSMVASDQYDALAKGTLDGTQLAPPSILSYKLSEIIKYGTEVWMVTGGSCFQINLKKWNSLPKDIQQIWLEEERKQNLHWAGWLDDNNDVILKQLEGQGMTIYKLPAEEKARWREICRPIWDEYAAANGEIGKKLLALVDKWSK